MIVDVQNKMVVLDAKGVKADDTRVESGLATAGALLVSGWITVASGGAKTPHQKKAAVIAVAKAFDPWLKALSVRKIE
jgi:hypothetical protein